VPIADLEAALDRGQPRIQGWQGDTGVANESAWATQWEDGHYVALTGYDDTNFYFMDPSMDPLPDGTKRYAYIPRSEFIDRWQLARRGRRQPAGAADDDFRLADGLRPAAGTRGGRRGAGDHHSLTSARVSPRGS